MIWQLFDRKGDKAAYRRHGGPIKRRQQTDKTARFFFFFYIFVVISFWMPFWVTSRLDQISTKWDMFHQVSIQISCDSTENWCATLLLVATRDFDCANKNVTHVKEKGMARERMIGISVWIDFPIRTIKDSYGMHACSNSSGDPMRLLI